MAASWSASSLIAIMIGIGSGIGTKHPLKPHTGGCGGFGGSISGTGSLGIE
jgi:hypothetical protein